MKGLQSRGPEFHLVQVIVQLIKRFDQILHDCVLRRFQHHNQALNSHERHSLRWCSFSIDVKGFLAFRFQRCQFIYLFALRLLSSTKDKVPPKVLATRRQWAAHPSRTHVDDGRFCSHLGEQRWIGAGHPDLGAEVCEFRMQRRASRRVQMGDNLIEQ